ncbi:MAG: helix-turn-helix domain-containing protein [Rhizobiaceae bacterium]
MNHPFDPTHGKYCLTVAQAVAFSGIARTTFYELIKQRHIVPRKVGKRTLIIRDELIEFLNNLPKSR